MTERAGPAVFTIPAEASFADALAGELVRRHHGDPLTLARGRILLPNARAVRTLTEAFVRVSGSGLLLPRLIPVGDPALDDRIGGAFDEPGGEPVPPAVDPLTRQAELARAIACQRGAGAGAAECWRLAGELARTLDQLLVEGVEPAAVRGFSPDDADLAAHQQRALAALSVLLEDWPQRLGELGLIDLAERRNRLLIATARRWQARPPTGFTIAAGITTAAPAIAALLRTIARLPEGAVVLPGLADALLLPDEQWHALGLEGEEGPRAEPTHPQYHLKLLLERMGVNRAEVRPWPLQGPDRKLRARSRVAAAALTAAAFSHAWSDLPAPARRLTGVRLAVLPDPASEAMAIALALREALETPARRAALVTPDRQLARRVAAQLRRWDIIADDSAGTPLSMLAPGSLLLALIEAAAERLSPVALLGLLGHPLVAAGEQRRTWLDDVRTLDLALRGPRPPGGIEGLDRAAAAAFNKAAAVPAWNRLRPAAHKVEALLAGPLDLASLAARLREAGTALAGDALWSGPAGRAAADLLAELEASQSCAAFALGEVDAAPLLRSVLDAVAVRPPFGQHPRVQILGLLEARLVRTELMVLGGLNEGSWPASPSPDPWLPAAVRRALGLPGAEVRIGLAAHDFAGLLCAPDVLLTRSRRDGRSPAVSSRLLLRLQALTGGLPRDRRLERLTLGLDDPAAERPVERPRPRPPVADRPRLIRVTDLDRLKADPFSFYARAMLRLNPLSPLGAQPDAAWRGIIVHRLFETWFAEDRCAPDRLLARVKTLLEADDIHPLLRSLWGPRLLEAIGRLAAFETNTQLAGRQPLGAEVKGEAVIAGIRLIGRADRIDRGADGSLAILDFKTGKPPAKKQVEAGFALQLGLLGLIAQSGGFAGISGAPGAFEYWSLAKTDKGDERGFIETMRSPAELLEAASTHFSEAASRWLTGNEPFTAKLQPRFALGSDYDQLMRLEEWLGRS